MKFLWDKMLVENQAIVKVRYKSMPQNIYYLFPSYQKALRQIERLKKEPDIMPDSISIKIVKEIFNDTTNNPSTSSPRF